MNGIYAKILVVLILVAVGLATVWALRTKNRRSRPTETVEYRELREQVLRGTRVRFGLVPEPKSTTPWGVVMDWGIDNRVVTVVALSDGSASLYYSSGGGLIGGGQSHDSVRKAAEKAVTIASEVQGDLKRTSNFSLPGAGEARFYLLTDAGVFCGQASVADLSSGRAELSKLGDAMQALITECMRVGQPSSGT
jgi:hypothetical protein